MQIGDLVKVHAGVEYDAEYLGIIISIMSWRGIREVKVRLMDGSIRSYSPMLVKVIN